jgi:HK97 family phage major capsid protein
LIKIAEIAARLEEISVEVEALADVALEANDSSDETLAQIEALNSEFDVLAAKKERLEAVQARVDEIVASRVTPSAPVIEPVASIEPELETQEMPKLPAVAKYNQSKVFASNEDAYTAGQYFMALAGNRKAGQFMADQSILDPDDGDTKGGLTVPTPLAAELIHLIESYGVARNVFRPVTMGAPTWKVPKLIGHSTVYYVDEAQPITASDLTFDNVTLAVRKMAGLVKMSTEIAEDSVISMADLIVRDLAWGFAKEEDECLFNGGTLYAGGIKGDSAVASDSGISATTAYDLALEDFTKCQVLSGQERGLNPKWYMNATLWNGPVRDLLNAANGNSAGDLTGGVARSLNGYEVVLVDAMNGESATSTDLVAVFGDLSVSHYFGDRRQLSFKVLDQLFAVNDQVGIMCTQRVDIASANPEVLSKIVLA